MTEQPTADPHAPQPEFGPGGYLPDRAARRARKIVLREQMSVGWPLASLVAAVVLLVAGGLFVLTRTGGPGAPWVPVAAFGDLGPRTATLVEAPAGDPLILVHTGSGVRALDAPGEAVALCPASGNLEAADGTVWSVAGQRLGGTRGSLAAYPVRVHSGTVYVDPTDPTPPPAPVSEGATPACD